MNHKALINEKITYFETKFKSKIIKEVSKLYYCLKRIIINTKSISSSDELAYSFYFTLKEVFQNIKTINISESDINYYGYNFNEDLINEINKINVTCSYGKTSALNMNIYYLKYFNNSINLIIINSNEINEQEDLQIMTSIKHIARLAKFEHTNIAA